MRFPAIVLLSALLIEGSTAMGGGGDRSVELLEKLMQRLDRLEEQLVTTQQQQQQLGQQQSRLEAVTVDSLSSMRNSNHVRS